MKLTLTLVVCLAIAAPSAPGEKDELLSVLSAIEVRLEGVRTTLRLDIYPRQPFAADERPGAGHAKPSTTVRAKYFMDRGRVRVEKAGAPDSGAMEIHIWNGTEYQRRTPDGTIYIGPYLEERILTGAPLFNGCHGPVPGAPFGLAHAVVDTRLLSVEERKGGRIYRLVPPDAENAIYELEIGDDPQPWIRSWRLLLRDTGDAPWRKRFEYRVLERESCGEYRLPSLAVRSIYKYADGESDDGTVSVIQHQYTRLDCTVGEEADIDQWFTMEYKEGDLVLNALSRVQWTVGSPLFYVDEVPYRAPWPLREDPTPHLERLIRSSTRLVGDGF